MKCPICDSAGAKVSFVSKHGRDIHSCQNPSCQHLFTPPLSSQQGVHSRPLDIEAESDESIRKYGERNERLLSLFLKHLAPKSEGSTRVFVDFGAGDAHISRSFKSVLKNEVEIYCIEPEEKCQPLYAKHGLICTPDLGGLNIKADLVYAVEVIEHLIDPAAELQRIRQVLKDDGVLFISTPGGHIREESTNAYDNSTHLHFFTPLSLNLALSMAGFEPIAYRHFSEIYPLSPKQTLRQKILSVISSIRRQALRLKSGRRSNPKMDMPRASDGSSYPYHLVGFSKKALSR